MKRPRRVHARRGARRADRHRHRRAPGDLDDRAGALGRVPAGALLAEIDEARALRAELPDSIVGGERDAIRIEGFDVGASPREFLEARAETLILSTTNGTRTIVTASERATRC